ncbi:MAG: hypothetical protein WCA81_09475 [Rhizomicrobium sp.]
MNTKGIYFALFAAALLVAGMAGAEPIKGWQVAGSAPANYDFGTEHTEGAAHSKSAFIAAKSAKPYGYGTLMQMILPDSYRGKRLRLTARIKTANADHAQLWMRIDGPNQKMLGFDNMDSHPVTGTTGWKRYEVVLDVPESSIAIAFGIFLNGGGKMWADDFRLEPVGKDVAVTGSDLDLRKAPTNLDFDQ